MSWIKFNNFLINKDNISRIRVIDKENQHVIDVDTTDGKSTTFCVEDTKYGNYYKISMREFVDFARITPIPNSTDGRRRG